MGKSKGKDRVKYRLCGLCGSLSSDTGRLRVDDDKYLALYEDKLVPIIFEDGEQFTKGPKDGNNGCPCCLQKHLSRLAFASGPYTASNLGDGR